MLANLGVLPEVVKDAIKELASKPECVKVIDKARLEEGVMCGGVYVVMKDGTPLWERQYSDVTERVMTHLEKEHGIEVWDMTEGVACSIEAEPLRFLDIDAYEENVDYRVLSKDSALMEVQ